MALWNEFTRLHREMLKIARADMVCRRLMTTPGVGALVALTYRSAVDDPSRFGKSAATGAYFGLTPKKYQSGETDRDGGVSKVGDGMVRTALFEAAHSLNRKTPHENGAGAGAMPIFQQERQRAPTRRRSRRFDDAKLRL